MRFATFGLLAAILLGFAVSCASIDPTEQAFAISFEYDLGRPVTLKLCGDSTCTSFPDSWKLAPRESAQDNVSDRGVVTRWLVVAGDERKRCLPLVFNAKYKNVVVKLSQAEDCPGNPLSLSRLRHGARLGGET